MIAKKKIGLALLVLIVVIIGLATYQYMYQPHRDIASEKVDFKVTPQALKEAMSLSNEGPKFLNKVIQTRGKITSVDQHSVTLDDIIQISFESKLPSYLNPEAELIIKGRCIGYDDLLELVKIDQATILTN